jgi:hypothetical protein
MKGDTLFGHVMFGLPVPKENLATEALRFILSGNPPLAEAFARLCTSVGSDVKDIASFDTQQMHEDGSIPDMYCRDRDGELVAIVENKFWAGLTDNQPLAYLRQLKPGGVLLFIVPDRRVQSVWIALMNRCKEAEPIISDGEMNTAPRGRTSDGRTLAVLDWMTVLRSLDAAAQRANDHRAASDIEQLMGLCRKMDAEAFLPITAEELTDLGMARRTMNFADLIHEVSEACIAQDIVKTRGADGGRLLVRHSNHGTGRYVMVGGFGAWLGFDPDIWVESGRTPFTLNFSMSAFGRARRVGDLIRTFGQEIASLDRSEWFDILLVPQTGVDKATVVKSLVDQVRRVRDVLVAGEEAVNR